MCFNSFELGSRKIHTCRREDSPSCFRNLLQHAHTYPMTPQCRRIVCSIVCSIGTLMGSNEGVGIVPVLLQVAAGTSTVSSVAAVSASVFSCSRETRKWVVWFCCCGWTAVSFVPTIDTCIRQVHAPLLALGETKVVTCSFRLAKVRAWEVVRLHVGSWMASQKGLPRISAERMPVSWV